MAGGFRVLLVRPSVCRRPRLRYLLSSIGAGGEGRALRILLRCCGTIVFTAYFLFSFLIRLAAIAFENISYSSPPSVPAAFRRVSSGMDLRSSKVEYKELFSGQIYHAVAEAPREPFPHDCRPNFSTAWSMKRSSVVFVFRRSVQQMESEMLQHILLDMPVLLFFTTYVLLVLFWAEIYYQALSYAATLPGRI